jgi:hypothetical protein
MNYCTHCGKVITKNTGRYCPNQCQSNHNYEKYIENWKNGSANGQRDIVAKKYLRTCHKIYK